METLPAIKYLEQLPEPAKTQAIQAAEEQALETRMQPVSNLASALSISFLWERTEQGRQYWLEISYRSLFN